MKKTNSLHLRISTQAKTNLENKAKNLGLNLTNYIEKVANEPVVFIDDNIQKFLRRIDVKGGKEYESKKNKREHYRN